MIDFIIQQCDEIYGYISTDKEQKHGFENSHDAVIKKLTKLYGEFTFAENGALVVFPNQREFTKKDLIYMNKLAHYKMNFDVQQATFMKKLFNGR